MIVTVANPPKGETAKSIKKVNYLQNPSNRKSCVRFFHDVPEYSNRPSNRNLIIASPGMGCGVNRPAAFGLQYKHDLGSVKLLGRGVIKGGQSLDELVSHILKYYGDSISKITVLNKRFNITDGNTNTIEEFDFKTWMDKGTVTGKTSLINNTIGHLAFGDIKGNYSRNASLEAITTPGFPKRQSSPVSHAMGNVDNQEDRYVSTDNIKMEIRKSTGVTPTPAIMPKKAAKLNDVYFNPFTCGADVKPAETYRDGRFLLALKAIFDTEKPSKNFKSNQENHINRCRHLSSSTDDETLEVSIMRFVESVITRYMNKHGIAQMNYNNNVRRASLRSAIIPGICVYCGCDSADSLEHVIPRSRTSAHGVGNALPACKECNGARSNHPIWQVVGWKRGWKIVAHALAKSPVDTPVTRVSRLIAATTKTL